MPFATCNDKTKNVATDSYLEPKSEANFYWEIHSLTMFNHCDIVATGKITLANDSLNVSTCSSLYALAHKLCHPVPS